MRNVRHNYFFTLFRFTQLSFLQFAESVYKIFIRVPYCYAQYAATREVYHASPSQMAGCSYHDTLPGDFSVSVGGNDVGES